MSNIDLQNPKAGLTQEELNGWDKAEAYHEALRVKITEDYEAKSKVREAERLVKQAKSDRVALLLFRIMGLFYLVIGALITIGGLGSLLKHVPVSDHPILFLFFALAIIPGLIMVLFAKKIAFWGERKTK